MDSLASEILLSIFIQLPFAQKQRCMLVCKRWRELIATRCLYHTLYIGTTNHGEGIPTYKKFINIMEQNPSLRNQVVVLFIEPAAAGDDMDLDTFTTYFTHLQRVSFSRRAVTFKDYCTDKVENTTPINRIEYISDSNGCELIQKLSADNLCTHLSELDLHLIVYTRNGAVTENLFVILPSLKNMPALKYLTLGRCAYSVDDLEELHSNIHSLETIDIEFSFMSAQELDLVDITPAETVKRLSVEVFPQDMNKCIDLLKFIRHKYTQLEHLRFYFHCYDYSEDDDAILKEIHDHGYLPLIEKLGPRLKSLELGGVESTNYSIIPKMDASHCQIKKISLSAHYDTKLLPILSKSQQAKYIEDLALGEMTWPSSYDFLKSFTSLKVLHIYFAGIDQDSEEPQSIVNLNTLLKSCPATLTSLHIFNTIVTFNRRGRRQVFPLQKLEIAYSSVENGFQSFFAASLPHCRLI